MKKWLRILGVCFLCYILGVFLFVNIIVHCEIHNAYEAGTTYTPEVCKIRAIAEVDRNLYDNHHLTWGVLWWTGYASYLVL